MHIIICITMRCSNLDVYCVYLYAPSLLWYTVYILYNKLLILTIIYIYIYIWCLYDTAVTIIIVIAADRTTASTAVFENRKRGKRRRVVHTPRNPSSENYRVTNSTILITMRFSFTNGGGYMAIIFRYNIIIMYVLSAVQ